MAVWKLIEPHYLSVPEHYWEHRETDRDTGRPTIRKLPVPTHLNPRDPSDWTHKTGLDVSRGGDSYADGDIIVAWANGYKYVRDDGKEFVAGPPLVGDPPKIDRRVLIFEGPPTPGMEPIDAEAKAIMAQFKWDDPFKDKYFGMSYAERLIFDKVTEGPQPDGMKELSAAVALLAVAHADTQKLLTQLAGQRRV